MKKMNPFGLFKFVSSLGLALYYLIQFFDSYGKKSLFLMLIMSLFFGMVLITEIIPGYLNSITEKHFNSSFLLLALVFVLFNTSYFWELSLPIQKFISVIMALICLSAGISLAFPFRKLKRYLNKRNFIS